MSCHQGKLGAGQPTAVGLILIVGLWLLLAGPRVLGWAVTKLWEKMLADALDA